LELERKQWIRQRLEELVGIFAIDVASFSVLDNHLHVLVYLDVGAPRRWSKTQVLERWAQLYPPRNACRQRLGGQQLKRWIKEQRADHQFVHQLRKRLVDLGWFMKSLKEPLSRLANEADGEEGAFWAARYKSIAVLDEAALLATSIYIDLNPLAAGLVPLPEQAPFTSLYLRVENCRRQGRGADLLAARRGTALGVSRCRGMENSLWLCPIENRVDAGRTRQGLLEGCSLGSYLLLLDETSRRVRAGKARVHPAADALLERLGTTRARWEATLERLFARPIPWGVAFAFDREKLRAAARQRGCHHLANLNGCPT
jgi:hypothetical protein